uniref:Zinc finger protein 366 n=1 Tax=Latimeria chalumnae TaxID=7897 RepID=H3B0Z6_LATCH
MQKEANQNRKENQYFAGDLKTLPSSLHCLQPLPLVLKPDRFSPFIDEHEPRFAHFRYDHCPGDLERFHASIEGGSRKRKSTPIKVTNSDNAEDAKVSTEMYEVNKAMMIMPSLPLPIAQPPQPKYSSQMIDLSNFGFQFLRALDHLGEKHIKEECMKHDIMWPGSPVMMHPPHPYYHNVHPGMMFPFFMTPPDLHFQHQFQLKQPEQLFLRAESRESEDNKHKVERVDVNIQIDDSYYVDVGNDQKRWQCRMCEKSYTSKYNLVTHILGHNGIKPHACSQCGKLFKQLSHLHTHMLTHQGTRPHKCQVCHKAFTQTSHLKRHMMQHSDVKPYTCGICGRGFAYPSELKAHESKHENGRENICVECGLDFTTLTQLKRHLTAHRGPTQYNCTECDKTFQYPSQLQNHMMKHKDIRPYICTECGMEFIQPHHLKQHSLTHKGVKEHKCGICGREFTLLANMKRHVLIHTNIRAYQCHLCFKSFVQKQTLKAHMIVHSDVKPFKCKLCGKEFNRMHNLMGHMHLHSDSKPFKCLYCPSKFTLKGNLTRHMKVKHGVREGGFNSQGFGKRGRIGLSLQADVISSMEQEEPFDLSQKGRINMVSSQSDGESTKGSSCQEEEDDEDDSYYRMYQYSLRDYHDDNRIYMPEDLSCKQECRTEEYSQSEEYKGTVDESGAEERDDGDEEDESGK